MSEEKGNQMKNYLCVNFRFPSIFTDNRKILLEMMFIPPGVVNVGSPCDEKDRDENENLQQFKISTGFLIGKYPVTNAQYFALVENWRRPSEKIHRNCIPVELVSFRQAKNFCEKLSKLFGEKFTLPTEAEWVHACLAGRPGPFPLGHPETYPSRYYNSVSTYREEKPLTRMQPQNAWGVQGMQGYLWQWCVDSLDYNRGILKGGSSAQHCSAWRAGSKLTNCEKRSFDMAGGYGFRIKMELNKNQLDQINSATGTQIEFNDSLSAHKRYFLVPEKVIKGETITKEIATEFIDEYDYSRFRDITEEAAIILGNEIGNLDLTGLEKLDANVAAALSKRKGSLLFDLVDITDEAAKEISNHSDDLIFFG